MNRLILLFFVSLLVVSSSACSEKKPPTDTAIKGHSVVAALEDMSHMYEMKNLPGFMNLVSENFKDRQTFASSIQVVFAKYETVRFTVQFTKMLIVIDNLGAPRADLNWDSEWQTEGGSILKNSGRGTFVFDSRDSKLVSIEGKNPFLPQPVETPEKQ